jgi:hypothetical protein
MARFWARTMALNHEIGSGSRYSVNPGLMATRRIDRVGMPKNVASILPRLLAAVQLSRTTFRL